MKILLTEQQYLIIEQTSGIDDFLNKVVNRYPIMGKYKNKLKTDIQKTGCKNIEMLWLRQASGVSLTTGVIISNNVFYLPLGDFIFVLFHELAHQYQFKKYGVEKMIGVYKNDISVSDAAEWMLSTEKVADEFGIRKVREYKKIGALNNTNLVVNMTQRKELTSNNMAYIIKIVRQSIGLQGNETLEEIGEKLYNFVKNNL